MLISIRCTYLLRITDFLYRRMSVINRFCMHQWKRKALLIDGPRFIASDRRQMTQYTNFPALRADNFHGALPYLIALIVQGIISLGRIKGSGNPSRRSRLLNRNVSSMTVVRHPRFTLKVAKKKNS